MTINKRDFPDLQPSEYALLQAEVGTGIVLDLAGKRYIGVGERYLTFTSLEALEEFATQVVQSCPEIECVAYDYQKRPSRYLGMK